MRSRVRVELRSRGRAPLEWGLAVALLALGVGGQQEARGCVLAAAGRPPSVQALHVFAQATTLERGGESVEGWEAWWLVSYDTAPDDQAIGMLFAVSQDTLVAVDDFLPRNVNETMMAIDRATEVSELRTRETSCQGCTETDRLFPSRVERGWSLQSNVAAEAYTREEASTLAMLDNWLLAHGLQVSAETRLSLELALAGGDKISMILGVPGPGPASFYPVHVRMAGALRLPFGQLPGCVDTHVTLSVVAGADQALTLDGTSVEYLDRLDREQMRSMTDLEAYLTLRSSEQNEAVFVVELVKNLSEPPLSVDTNSGWRDLLGASGLATRLQAIVSEDELSKDLLLVPDPEGHTIEPFLDLRPDPQAHGASMLPLPDGRLWMGLGLLLFLFRRRPKAR